MKKFVTHRKRPATYRKNNDEIGTLFRKIRKLQTKPPVMIRRKGNIASKILYVIMQDDKGIIRDCDIKQKLASSQKGSANVYINRLLKAGIIKKMEKEERRKKTYLNYISWDYFMTLFLNNKKIYSFDVEREYDILMSYSPVFKSLFNKILGELKLGEYNISFYDAFNKVFVSFFYIIENLHNEYIDISPHPVDHRILNFYRQVLGIEVSDIDKLKEKLVGVNYSHIRSEKDLQSRSKGFKKSPAYQIIKKIISRGGNYEDPFRFSLKVKSFFDKNSEKFVIRRNGEEEKLHEFEKMLFCFALMGIHHGVRISEPQRVEMEMLIKKLKKPMRKIKSDFEQFLNNFYDEKFEHYYCSDPIERKIKEFKKAQYELTAIAKKVAERLGYSVEILKSATKEANEELKENKYSEAEKKLNDAEKKLVKIEKEVYKLLRKEDMW